MIKHSFLRVDEVAEILEISKSYAYKIVQKLNAELKEQGLLMSNVLDDYLADFKNKCDWALRTYYDAESLSNARI